MMQPHWLKPDTQAFTLTNEQRDILDAARTHDEQVMFLQQWHQQYCWENMKIVGVPGSLDPVMFSKRWNADFYDLSDAWAAYRGEDRRAA